MKMSIYTVEKTVQFNRVGIFIDFHKIDPEVNGLLNIIFFYKAAIITATFTSISYEI